MELLQTGPYWLTRLFFQRSVGFIYLIAFLVAFNQYRGLLGENGILPVASFVKRVRFWDTPSLFHLNSSDAFVLTILGLGIALSVCTTLGLSEKFGITVSGIIWALLWIFYLSITNVGQTWYAFGWESILLEAGFFAIFLGSEDTAPPVITIWILKWLLFRVMFGAGLIKLRADPCWKDLTCLIWHYETQPMPGPLSWYFHQLPVWVHKGGVLFTHLVELVVPFAIFLPAPFCWWAGVLMIALQVTLILSGNLAFLNYVTLVLCLVCFDDNFFQKFFAFVAPSFPPMGLLRFGVLMGLALLVVALSINPVKNMLSPRQAMNRSYNPFHLVGTYGAFGAVTKKRYEIVISGAGADGKWREYEFKGKPGDPNRRPPQIAPYHLRLDWLMWFAAMGDYYHYPWLPKLLDKLLEGDRAVLKLLKHNPFSEKPPVQIKADLYLYRFTSPEERKPGLWWHRQWVREYFSPLSQK